MVILFAAWHAPGPRAAGMERRMAAGKRNKPRISTRSVERPESPPRVARSAPPPRRVVVEARIGSLAVFSLPTKAFKVYRPAA